MRVWHSAWSWLNEMAAADSVAGNTLTGMLTRLTFRKPFQVGRAGMHGVYRVCTRFALDGVVFGPGAEVQARASHPEGVFANLIPQHLPGLSVEVARNLEPPRDVAE